MLRVSVYVCLRVSFILLNAMSLLIGQGYGAILVYCINFFFHCILKIMNFFFFLLFLSADRMGWRLMGAAEENSCQCCVPSREIKMCLCRDSNSVSGALATVPPTTSNAYCVVRLRRHFWMQAFGWLHKQIWTLMSHGKIFSSSSLSMSLFKKKIWFSRKLIWALFLTCIIAETGVIPSLISS